MTLAAFPRPWYRRPLFLLGCVVAPALSTTAFAALLAMGGGQTAVLATWGRPGVLLLALASAWVGGGATGALWERLGWFKR